MCLIYKERITKTKDNVNFEESATFADGPVTASLNFGLQLKKFGLKYYKAVAAWQRCSAEELSVET